MSTSAACGGHQGVVRPPYKIIAGMTHTSVPSQDEGEIRFSSKSNLHGFMTKDV
jgi:hypothetical protein